MASMNHRKQTQKYLATTLSHDQYSVGWICALPCELTAAECMLDEKHSTLPNPPGDKNVYVLGAIAGHNVVITILPAGVYGATSAAAVAIRMTTTFRNISIPLLVGIGGGVPKDDLRLGDIVVSVPGESNAVVQYDFGKSLRNEEIRRTGHLRKPDERLLGAVGLLRARHKAYPSQVLNIMSRALKTDPQLRSSLSYPGCEKDRLYIPDCSHHGLNADCGSRGCEQTLIERPVREDNAPQIYYGTIASGNLVIKDSRMRDKIASELGAICFEMEAAGIMDYFPALVIRGISDYCDGKKDKVFQPYSAFTAAAFAKELLLLVPQSIEQGSSRSIFDSVIKQHIDKVVQSLDFSEVQSRLLTIKEAHYTTLRWFVHHHTYRTWLDDSYFDSHHGFLWIKAKPAAGKSILMKYLLSQHQVSHETISFFFNARGTSLQKSTVGMYRSLLSQLLTRFKEVSYSLDLLILKDKLDTLEILRALFKATINQLSSPLTCFIDALDESSEEEIRDLLEDLETIATSNKAGYFRVCCSSRYYPHISLQAGLEIRLDKETEHDNDIKNYVEAKLRIGNSQVAKQVKIDIVEKAAGVFLWVVLVVQILARDFDRGRIHSLRRKLNETPEKLSDLIRNILLRDNENLPDLVACMQWILYSERPLHVEEFYYAVMMRDHDYELMPYNPDDITPGDMERFILSCSKGLLESTRGADPIVQVIHESVRELMMSDNLVEVYSGFVDLAPGPALSHLSGCCARYLSEVTTIAKDTGLLAWIPKYKDNAPEFQPVSPKLSSRYPFLIYARSEVLTHAEKAEKHCIPQKNILDTYQSCIEPGSSHGYYNTTYSSHRLLSQLLVAKNLPELLRRHLNSEYSHQRSMFSRARDFAYATKGQLLEVVKVLLEPAPGPSVDVEKYQNSIRKILVSSHLQEKSFSQTLVVSSNQYIASFMEIISQRDTDNALLTCLLDSEEWLQRQESAWIRDLVQTCALFRFEQDDRRLFRDGDSILINAVRCGLDLFVKHLLV